MTVPRVLTLILAGGAGSRLEPLTDDRAKAAVPFAGVYRLIDFPLSNCQHAHLPDVWIAVQYHPSSLAVHLANGRPWDLDRTAGGLMTLPPYLGDQREGWHEGTADALWRYADLIRAYGADALVVLSADAVYRLDYRAVVDAHLDHGDEATMVTTEVAADDAGRYGVVQVGAGGRVERYDLKPDEPVGRTVSNEVFVFRPDAVLERLEALAAEKGAAEKGAAEKGAAEKGAAGTGDDEGLEDLGSRLLPELAEDGQAWAYPLDGYWRDVGTLPAYWQAHQDFLAADPPLALDDPAWPVHTRGGRHSAAALLDGADVTRSLVAGGSRVGGTVTGSVLSPGVVVEPGAHVVDSVLLHGVRVAAGATVVRAVLDDGVTVGKGASVGGSEELTVLAAGTAVQAG